MEIEKIKKKNKENKLNNEIFSEIFIVTALKYEKFMPIEWKKILGWSTVKCTIHVLDPEGPIHFSYQIVPFIIVFKGPYNIPLQKTCSIYIQ